MRRSAGCRTLWLNAARPRRIAEKAEHPRDVIRIDDYEAYIDLIAGTKDEASVSIWAYCLMPNHIHLVAVPDAPDGLAKLFRDAHRSYTRRINFREGWRGHLWQERFHSCVMDERNLMAAVRYIELNPGRKAIK